MDSQNFSNKAKNSLSLQVVEEDVGQIALVGEEEEEEEEEGEVDGKSEWQSPEESSALFSRSVKRRQCITTREADRQER